jgi:hypothetical protein
MPLIVFQVAIMRNHRSIYTRLMLVMAADSLGFLGVSQGESFPPFEPLTDEHGAYHGCG